MHAAAPASSRSAIGPAPGNCRSATPGWLAAAGSVALAGWLARDRPSWVAMWTIAFVEFYALKIATLVEGDMGATPHGRLLGYLFAWPGMNARTFLAPAVCPARPAPRELLFALAKLAAGGALLLWALRHAGDAPSLAVTWVGMLGMILVLHFGVFHAVSWVWRAGGIDAPPIMRAPIAARSLADFWGGRWNLAFAGGARRWVLRPLARRFGTNRAGLAVFALSGLVHETVISLPARGGWGGPMLYFLLQALGLAVEKSAWGARRGLGRGARGRAWMLFFTAAPLPLLFPAAFVRGVMGPFLRTLAPLLP